MIAFMSTQNTALTSVQSIERALQRFGWLGDYDETLAKIGITRDKLRALEADDEISAALETRRFAAINIPWRFEHPSARIRKFYTEAFAPVLPVLLNTAWQAIPYGYSVVELVYREEAGRIVPDSVLDLPFEWFQIKPDGLTYWRQANEPADPRKFFATVNAGSLRKPHGDALLAKAYWPWFFRTHGWKFWAKFLEQAAIPLLVGKTQHDKLALLDMLRSLSQGPVAAIADVESIESVDTPGNASNKFTEFEMATCRRIQRLILGQTLTSGTDGGAGNRALGEVHNKVREEKRSADTALLRQSVQRVVDVVAVLNGLDTPTFIMEDGSGLELERAKRDQLLVRAGMLRFTATYLQEKYGLEPDDFEMLAPEVAANVADVGVSGAQLSARLARQAAPLARRKTEFTPQQQAVEDAADALLDQVPEPIDPDLIGAAVRAARDPADLAVRLSLLLDERDPRFAELLARAQFAAQTLGYVVAETEAPTPKA